MSTLSPQTGFRPLDRDPALLLRETRWMRELALGLIGDGAAADDVTQEAWVAALGRSWPQGLPPRSWLRQVVRNLAVTWRRRQSRRLARESRVATPESVPHDGQLVARLEAQRALVQAVCELEEPTRTIVLLRYQEDLEPVAIARRLGVPAGTVRSRLSRGLARLRGALTVRGHDLRTMLLPLTTWRIASVGGTKGVWTGSTLLAGVAMKKTLAATVLVFLSFALWGVTHFALGAGSGEETAVELGEEAGVAAGGPGRAEPPRSVVNDAEPFGSRVGWWLEGFARSPAGFGQEPVRVRVTDARGKISAVVAGVSSVSGRTELDLGGLFRDPEHLLHRLYVDFEHPEHLPKRVAIDVDRHLRQVGFRHLRGRLAFDVDLEPVTSRLSGVVRVPPGCPHSGVRVAAVAVVGGRPAKFAADEVEVGRRGDFVLRARRGVRYLVVAWRRGTPDSPWSLRPSHIAATASARDLRIELTEGASIEGYLDTGRYRPDVELRLWIRRESRQPGDDLAVRDLGLLLADVASQLRSVEENMQLALDDMTAVRPVIQRSLAVTWDGDSFEHERLQTVVAPGGSFRCAGLAPETSYEVGNLNLYRTGVRVRTYGDGGGMDARTVTAPVSNLRMEVKGRLLAYRINREGRPLVTDLLLVRRKRDEGSWAVYGTGRDGCFGVWSGAVEGPPRRTLQMPGCIQQEVESTPYRWKTVLARRDSGAGDLVLRFAGDSVRQAEGWYLTLRRSDGKVARFLDPRGRRRLDDEQTFTGIPSGRYRAELLPHRDWLRPDPEAMLCMVSFDVEIVPGGVVHRMVHLQQGGVAAIPDVGGLVRAAGLGEGSVPFRLRDASDRIVPVKIQSVPSRPGRNRLPRRPATVLPPGGGCRFYPVLAPGAYTLELGASSAVAAHRIGFTIRGGECTEIGVR